MMRVLVTGASGFIGAALCRALRERGYFVRALVRSAAQAEVEPDRMQQLAVRDIAEEFDWKAALNGIDAVVHLAAIAHRDVDDAQLHRVNVGATVRLAQAAAGSVRRFVFLSSVKVHGENSGAGAYAESGTLRPEDAYGRSKLDGERALADIGSKTGMEVVLVRPPLTYGPTVKANFLRLLRWIDSGRPLPLASVSNRRSLLYLGNLVDGIIRCIEHPAAKGPFLFSDEEAVSTPELVSRIALALGRSSRLFPVPLSLLRVAGAIVGQGAEIRRLTGSLLVDTTRARRLLDWRPPCTLDEGLAETARWFISERGMIARGYSARR